MIIYVHSYCIIYIKQIITLKISPIREVLLQFMAVIRKFTGKMENNEEMEIKELLLSSADNMKSAVAIRNALDEVKQEIILKVFQAIVKRIEIDEKIIVGYCCPVNGKAGKQPLNQEEAETILNIKLRSNDWWASCEYCTIENECPDFKNMNDAYYKLFDEAYFNKYIDYCTDKILSLL